MEAEKVKKILGEARQEYFEILDEKEFDQGRKDIVKRIFLANSVLESCKEYYKLILSYRIMQAFLKAMFGNDIGTIIWQYWDDFVIFDEMKLVSLVTCCPDWCWQEYGNIGSSVSALSTYN